jgi:protein TonB
MNRAARRRHFVYFSASLVVHILLFVTLVGLLVIVSDVPSTDSGRPLLVSLDRGEEPGSPPKRMETREKLAVPQKRPVRPEPSWPKVAGDESNPGDIVGGGNPPGVSGSAGKGNANEATALTDYVRAVRARIERHKRYPPTAARDSIEGSVTVSFLIGRRGTVLDKRIDAGSGSPLLDEAALAAVADSSPFPPLPDELDRETLRLRLPINYEAR